MTKFLLKNVPKCFCEIYAIFCLCNVKEKFVGPVKFLLDHQIVGVTGSTGMLALRPVQTTIFRGPPKYEWVKRELPLQATT